MQSQNGGWGAFDADNEYLLSQQHPVRRPRRLARSADRGRHRALRLDAGAARRDAENAPAVAARGRLSAPHAAGRGQLVRPLGHELHLRHLVGAVRAQRRRRRSRRAGDAQGGGLAGRDPERRRRLGRGRHELQARLPRLRAGAEHRVADRLGAARADGGGRGRSSGGGARHRLSVEAPRAATASGTRRATPRPASRACSICATTAIRNSSRSGRWRAIAT